MQTSRRGENIVFGNFYATCVTRTSVACFPYARTRTYTRSCERTREQNATTEHGVVSPHQSDLYCPVKTTGGKKRKKQHLNFTRDLHLVIRTPRGANTSPWDFFS